MVTQSHGKQFPADDHWTESRSLSHRMNSHTFEICRLPLLVRRPLFLLCETVQALKGPRKASVVARISVGL
jgi:hypothetical protein